MTRRSIPHLVLEPRRGWIPLDLRALWSYRELLFFLTWRDVKVRYKQTVLGLMWAVLQPLLSMVVFTVFFGRLAKVPSDGVPYPVFAYCALVPWQLFAFSLSESSTSLVTNQNLIKKVYFPRLVVPISSCLAGLVDFAISTAVLGVLMACYGIVPTAAAVFLPLFVLLAVVTALAVGIWFAALNVEFRDVRYTVPFLTQLWLFATPVAYPASMVPERLRWVFGLNPMAGVVEGFRWSLLGTGRPPTALLGVSASVVLVLLVGGLFYFRRMEETFADVV
jgi:lipopolysaccharide transport system permease protein